MDVIEMLETAKQVATKASNFIPGCSRRQAMGLNITVDGPVVVKQSIIVVPVDVFRFSTFNSVKRRVILDRHSFAVLEIKGW